MIKLLKAKPKLKLPKLKALPVRDMRILLIIQLVVSPYSFWFYWQLNRSGNLNTAEFIPLLAILLLYGVNIVLLTTYFTKDKPEDLTLNLNDYLQLRNHPSIIQAAQKALEVWGTSSGGSPVVGSYWPIHQELENVLINSRSLKGYYKMR